MRSGDTPTNKFSGDMNSSPWPADAGLGAGPPPGWSGLGEPPHNTDGPNTNGSHTDGFGRTAVVGDLSSDEVSAAKAGAHPAEGGTTSTTTNSLPVEPPSPTPFTIAIEWDASVASAPVGFTTGVLAAVQYLETQFVDPVTITIDVGYNEIDGSAMSSGALGESETYLTSVSYASLVGAVQADATTATDASVVASLPATSPIGGANYWVTSAQAEALGLVASNTSLDGYVGFDGAAGFTYGDTATSGTVASGTYDFFGTAVHEITEVMGRQMLTGDQIGGSGAGYSLLDLLHYSASGVRDLSPSMAGYLSVDGGVTNLGAFNTVAGGDSGDWASSVGANSFDAYSNSNVLNAITANDLTEMDALGWTPAAGSGAGSGGPSPPPPPPPPPASTPTGVLASPVTASLASIQGSSGLSRGAALAKFTQTGGLSADSYGYVLGGSGAAAFSLSTSNNVATLASNTAAGSANGRLYALTMTTTDRISGSSSPAVPVNVVVGSAGNDIVNLASMSGIAKPAPTFIYGLGGNDTINGTGMTGAVYFDAGTGADVMTGGSGLNNFEYGAVSDSTGSAMDIITNFNVSMDLINVTGLGTAFNAVAALSSTATSIAAHSIGWQTSGGDTFVYVNTGSRSETLTSADMKIELSGTVALTAHDFVHL